VGSSPTGSIVKLAQTVDSAVDSVLIRGIFRRSIRVKESPVANKEQKRSSREAKKPKQKKKEAEKRSASKATAPQT
jgi:hypothetical protein